MILHLRNYISCCSAVSLTCTIVVGYSGKALATACAPNRFVLPDNPTKISLPVKIKMRMKVWSKIIVSVHLVKDNQIFWDKNFCLVS